MTDLSKSPGHKERRREKCLHGPKIVRLVTILGEYWPIVLPTTSGSGILSGLHNQSVKQTVLCHGETLAANTRGLTSCKTGPDLTGG